MLLVNELADSVRLAHEFVVVEDFYAGAKARAASGGDTAVNDAEDLDKNRRFDAAIKAAEELAFGAFTLVRVADEMRGDAEELEDSGEAFGESPDARALRAEPSRVASLSGFERLVLG